MKLNRKWLLVIALVLSLGMATSGTLAYLTATDTAVNTFTVGNVDIELDEPNFPEEMPTLLPGVEIPKDPQITNTGNTEAWVWTKISLPTALYEKLDIVWDTTGEWAEHSVSTSGANTVVTMKRANKLAPDATTAAVFTKVSIPTTIKDLSDLGNLPVDIVVNAFAIQDEGFETVEDAMTDYDGPEGSTAPTRAAAATADELANALAAGGEVWLTEDITVTSSLTIPAGKNAKINLNNHDLTYAVSGSTASAIINNKGNLELTGTGTLSYVAANPDLGAIPTYATNTITNTGTLTINEGITIANASDGGASYAVDVQGGKFIMNGGTLQGNRCALRIARFNADTEFVMNGGTVTAATPAWIQLPGSNPTDAPSIKVTINDGTFKTTKESSADNDVLYTYSFGNSHANTTIDINGGKFLGGTVSIGSGYKGDAPTLNINGGSFDYDVLQWLEDDSSNVLYTANN